MNVSVVCLLIVAVYTLILLLIAAWYSTNTIRTLGDLVRQLIDKIDGLQVTTITDTHEDDTSDEDSSDDNDELNPPLQDLFEDYRSPYAAPRDTWHSYVRHYGPKNEQETDESKELGETEKSDKE